MKSYLLTDYNTSASATNHGRIYAKPFPMGNFLHFTVAALALLKFAINGQNSMYVWAATIVYSIFAVLFGLVVFTSPRQVIANRI